MIPRVAWSLLLVVGLVGAEAQWHSGARGVGVDGILAEWPLRDPAPVVVAVLDSGFDLDHPALAPALWTNAAEAEGVAGRDDDGNGFVDDRHGWNFLCSAEGEQLIEARMEVTRLYAALQAEVEAGTRPADDPRYREIAALFAAERDGWRRRLEFAYLLHALRRTALADLRAAGVAVDEPGALAAADPESWRARAALAVLRGHASGGLAENAEAVVEEAIRWLEVGYNPAFDESTVLGDDPGDPADLAYGGPQLSIGWRDTHGTMVAGIIGGAAWAEGGTRGLAPGARLLLLRTTPFGDERDKDVAAGIRYAVAAGARVINCSFGKPYSPQKAWVDAAMREAEAAGVLVVVAAGNEGHERMRDNGFPTPHHADGRFANWLVVGASRDDPDGPVAPFSNWSATEVDLFAPGEAIRAPAGEGGVETLEGTSFAAPCVSGVAALLWSQFPQATVDQVKAAILAGVRRVPGSDLDERCASGGLLDARGALVALARAMGDESILPEGVRGQ